MNSIVPVMMIATLMTVTAMAGGCTSQATVELKGTPGAPVTGYYIRDGRRVAFNGVLPMTLREPGITQVAVRKVNAGDALEVSATDANGSGSTGQPAGHPGGIRVDLADGMNFSSVGENESLAPAGNALIVIAPYWYEGTWVFDDASTGLVREPFVQGVPELIDDLVKDILDARQGFRLTASAKPFPGYQRKFVWERPEAGGNYYKDPATGREGWLCPAMFRYFAAAPKELYVRADAKPHGGS